MRAWALAGVLLMAGCFTSEEAPAADATPTGTTPTTTPSPGGPADAPVPSVGERDAPMLERFILDPNHGLTILGNESVEEGRVKDSTNMPEFYSSAVASTIKVPTWVSPPLARSLEVTGPIEVTLSFVADQPGVSGTKPFGFPPVGGWFGTEERYAHLFVFSDAPDTIEAGKVYTLRTTFEMPDLFVPAGEPLALRTFLGYNLAPTGSLHYVVGGPDPAGVLVPHAHFDISGALVETPLLEEQGATGPNPGTATSGDPQAAEFDFEVPPGAVYVHVEAVGVGQGQGNYDVDLVVMRASDQLGSGSGPTSQEVVLIGPKQLDQGRAFTARVQTASTGGGTWTLRVTSYGPAGA